MSNLYLFTYNNYYNRIVKKEATLSDYPSPLHICQNCNFNPNDGVNTSHVVNTDVGNADYAIVADDLGNIVSRWFIIESKRERNGQYVLTLHRDVIVDNYDAVVSAPCFIEKATLSANNPLLFNKESMGYNQIKQYEVLMQDQTRCGWIVGYIPRDAFKDKTEQERTITTEIYEADSDYPDIVVPDITQWSYYQYTNQHIYPGATVVSASYNIGIDYESIEARILTSPSQETFDVTTFDRDDPVTYVAGDFVWHPIKHSKAMKDGLREALLKLPEVTSPNTFDNALTNILKNRLGNTVIDHDTFEDLQALEGQIIKDETTNTYYKIRLKLGDSDNITFLTTDNTLKNIFASQTLNTDDITMTTSSASEFGCNVQYYYQRPYLSLEQINETIKTTVPLPKDRRHLEDAPYDMFAIPFADGRMLFDSSLTMYPMNKESAILMAQSIALTLGSGSVYDIQYLPYCPETKLRIGRAAGYPDTFFVFNDYGANLQFTKIFLVRDPDDPTEDVPCNFILWCSKSNFKIDIPTAGAVADITDPIEKKVESETSLYRMCSPNYQSVFEIDPQKNGGISKWTATCTYKPFSPYIHLAPDFKGLYSNPLHTTDKADLRGLTLSGDFSLTQLSDAWANYQQNNKNFQAIFDREVEHIDFNNNKQHVQDIISASTGVLSGTISGAVAGSSAGPWGALAGGIAGLGTSVIGGIADVEINQELRNEALDYTKDQFGYQLGNIKALPQALTKVSAFSIDNRIFPFLEYYTCSDIEKQALRDKIKYNGMTVMAIGTIGDYLQEDPSYIKGKIIRLPDLEDDFHMGKTIAEEIYKGVFI